MHIAIYANTDSQSFKRLHHIITSTDVGQPPEVHSDLNLFCECFRAVAYHPDLIIIMPTCFDELETLAVARDLFASIRTIVILPERDPPTISQGHLFHPSFITFDDDDFQDLALILKHLCSHRPCTAEIY
jgi:hypothetical protein